MSDGAIGGEIGDDAAGAPVRESVSWARIESMYSEQVLEHFRNPRNAGKLESATAVVQATNPVCGDVMELAVRVEDGKIVEARFLCRGCTTAIASGSWAAEELVGKTAAEARRITAERISEGLGGLPAATFHGAQLAAEAVKMVTKRVGRHDERSGQTSGEAGVGELEG